MTKQQTITEMFDDISPRYDFLNHLLSLNLDRGWRRKVSKLVTTALGNLSKPEILDVATGTADLALQMAKDLPSAQITGIDLSQNMLDLGQRKVKAKGLEQRVCLRRDDAMALSFRNESFDAVTVAFGVRNFSDLSQGVHEMVRVLKKGGTLVILEFAKPTHRWIKGGYHLYTHLWLPLIGRLVSGHRSAYRYLPESIERFPSLETNIRMLEEAGLSDVQTEALLGGVALLYHGRK